MNQGYPWKRCTIYHGSITQSNGKIGQLAELEIIEVLRGSNLLGHFHSNSCQAAILEGNNTLSNGVQAQKLPSFSPVGERVLKHLA